MREIDIGQYVSILKNKGVDISEVVSYLENIISSNASKQLPAAQ